MSDLLNSASLVMIPSGYKEDVVYSQIPTDGSGDLTFTRASNGTRVNSAGLVEVVPWNLFTYSEDFANADWIKVGSTISSNVLVAPNGTTTADKLVEDTSNGVHIALQITGGRNVSSIYAFSVYAKAGERTKINLFNNGNGVGEANFDLVNGTATLIAGEFATIESVGNGWYRCVVGMQENSTAGNFNYHIRLLDGSGSNSYTGNGTSGAYIWGAQVNLGTAKPYFPTTDRLNVPRLTYQNGGGGCPSLLLEKQSTNLATQSTITSFGSGTNDWLNGAGSPASINQTTGIDGTQNGTKYTRTAGQTTDDYFYKNTVPVTSGTTYTVSGYIKLGTASNAVVVINNTSAWNSVPNGSIVCSTANGFSTTAWKRFELTITGPSTNQINIHYGYHQETGVTAQATGTFFLDGLQVEASSYATSLIPTTSSSATRVADASPDTATLLSNKLSYSVFLDFYPRPLGNFQYFFIQKNSSANAEIIWGGTSGGTDFAIYDYTAGSICNVAINDGNRHKIVLSQASGKIDVFVDGSQVATQKTTSATGFYYVAFDGNPGIYKINELAIMSKITNADAIALTTL